MGFQRLLAVLCLVSVCSIMAQAQVFDPRFGRNQLIGQTVSTPPPSRIPVYQFQVMNEAQVQGRALSMAEQNNIMQMVIDSAKAGLRPSIQIAVAQDKFNTVTTMDGKVVGGGLQNILEVSPHISDSGSGMLGRLMAGLENTFNKNSAIVSVQVTLSSGNPIEKGLSDTQKNILLKMSEKFPLMNSKRALALCEKIW